MKKNSSTSVALMPVFWKKHYVVETNADEIEKSISLEKFLSGGDNLDLVALKKHKSDPNILISPGSGGHSYVFAELAYQIHLKGYNVFIMPKHGSITISELMRRHEHAIRHVADNYNDEIGVFAEGLGAYASFYLSLECHLMKSAAYMNGPVIMTEKKFHEAWKQGNGTARKRRIIFPFAKFLSSIFPWVKLPIRSYLDFKEMIDREQANRVIEAPLIKEGFSKDPDFDRSYPLSSIMSLVYTPPPRPLSELRVPTMFMVPVRGFFPSYERDLFSRLPDITKRIVDVDGGVFWMISHPKEAAGIICQWFNKTLSTMEISNRNVLMRGLK
jgi:hypothetical protein